jgi:hypothetical protein
VSNNAKALITFGIVALLMLGMIIWSTAGSDIRPNVVGGLFTLVAATGAAGVAFWQLRRQGQNAIAANSHNEKLKLKKDIYGEIVDVCRAAGEAQAEFTGYIVNITSQLETYLTIPKLEPTARWNTIAEKQADARRKALRIIALVEKWEIVDPRIRVFWYAMNAAIEDVQLAFTPYYNKAVTMLPINLPNAPQSIWNVPSRSDVDKLHDLTQKLIVPLEDLGTYVDDFQREMQNALLRDLFDKNEIRRRQPLDSKLKVIELEKHEELIHYFENETAWGKRKQAAEERLRNVASTP